MQSLLKTYRWYVQKLWLYLFRNAHFYGKFAERDGIRLLARDPAISDKMFWHLHHDYESAERALLNRYIEPGDKVLELGAGIGYLAIVSLKKAATQYAAVEANSDLLSIIATNLKENGVDSDACKIINAIVSDSDGRVAFNRRKNFWSSRIDEAGTDLQDALSTNELLSQIGFDPNFLIMDIEGGEKGIRFENFGSCSKILIEVHPQYIGQEACCMTLNRIISLGFELKDSRGTTYFLEKPR